MKKSMGIMDINKRTFCFILGTGVRFHPSLFISPYQIRLAEFVLGFYLSSLDQ
jgi:hypothetical protein